MIKCIVKMEMPESCRTCPVEVYGFCGFTNKNILGPNRDFPLNRPKGCPIEREFVTCEDCVHEDAARRGVCMYDWDICIGGVRKENK